MISRSLKDKSIKMRERLHDWMDLNRQGQEGDMFHATDPRVRDLLQRTAGVLKPGAGQEEAMAFAEALRVVERALSPAADGMCNADNPASCREEFGHRVCAAPPAAGVPVTLKTMRYHAHKIWCRVEHGTQEYEAGRTGLGCMEDVAESALYLRNKFDEMLAAPAPPASEQHRAVVIPKGSVLVGKSVLALARNSLKRDAESGLQVRGEILAELDQSIARYDRLVNPHLAKGEGV